MKNVLSILEELQQSYNVGKLQVFEEESNQTNGRIGMINDVLEEEVKTKKKIATHIKMFNFKEINAVLWTFSIHSLYYF